MRGSSSKMVLLWIDLRCPFGYGYHQGKIEEWVERRKARSVLTLPTNASLLSASTTPNAPPDAPSRMRKPHGGPDMRMQFDW